MNKLPPSVPTDLHPEDIVGGYRDLIERHFQKTYRPFNGDFDKAAKTFSHDERAKVAEIYAELRDYGFHPIGFNEHGEIKWGYRVTNDKNKERDEEKYRGSNTPQAALEMIKSLISNITVEGGEPKETENDF